MHSCIDKILHHPVEALLGDAQDIEEFCDGEARLAHHEVQHAMMGAPESMRRQEPVRIADEVAVGEEKQLDEIDHRRRVVGRKAVTRRDGVAICDAEPFVESRRHCNPEKCQRY